MIAQQTTSDYIDLHYLICKLEVFETEHNRVATQVLSFGFARGSSRDQQGSSVLLNIVKCYILGQILGHLGLNLCQKVFYDVSYSIVNED